MTVCEKMVGLCTAACKNPGVMSTAGAYDCLCRAACLCLCFHDLMKCAVTQKKQSMSDACCKELCCLCCCIYDCMKNEMPL